MKKIEPVVADKNFNRLGVIDDYSSLIWASRYYTCGDFELCVDVSQRSKEILKLDHYVIRDDDDNVGIIERIEIQTDENQREIVIVSGRFLPSILSRRIISVQTLLNGTVSNGIYNLILQEAISPVDEKRRIPNLLFAYSNFTDKLDAQYTGKNLLTVIEEICETYGIGHKTTLTDEGEFLFQLYKGVDRSYNQTENPYVIFSDDYDNLLSSQYSEDKQELITDVLVAGEGEGLERKTLWVSEQSLTGLDRYEKYQDQRNLSTNEGAVSEEEYYQQMKEEGLESINTMTTAFLGTVYFDNIEYKKDVFLGDICVIENTYWGIYINSRLVEVVESVDESGEYSINPTFGI